MIIGERGAFDFFLECYKNIIVSREQNIEQELIDTFQEYTFSPYLVAYQNDHRIKSSIRFPDFYVNRYIKSSDDKKMGASHFDPEGFDILCRKFPEYINLSNSRLEPILFTTIESEDLRSLNRFRGNEFVDWHIEYNGMYPLDKVLEKKNPRLTNMFLEILFTKGNQLNFMLVVSEDAGIELTINVSHPNDGGTDYLVKLNLGGLQENFDITICNEHLTNYAYLQYVSLLTQVIQGETCLDIQKLLIDYHDRERMRMDVSGMVEMGIYSGSAKKDKIPKGKKLKKEDSGNIQLITEDTEDAATHVTFLERTVLLEEGGCLVKTQTPNVYVYCDETFWNDENPDMIETIKTGKFYLRGAGYAIRATINAEGFENIETSVPMKFNTGRGDRVYCAQLKDDIIDNLGKQCTIYLPCKYVSAGNHDQYVKGGNIEFDLHLPDLQTDEYEITALPQTFS
jgi:hypothetical protein